MVASAPLLGGGILGGVIACTNTSVSVAGTYNVIPQSKVDLICGASGTSMPVVVKSSHTNTAGLYTFLFTSADTILLNGGKCVITCANTSLSTVRTFPVIPQAKVDVVCGFLFFPSVTKSVTTNSAGIYSISFNTADVLFNNPNACYLNVNLPAYSCTFDPLGGALRFPIVTIRSDLGVVTAFVHGAMSYVP
ncbi:hypothetical protein BUALT_Bualt07G0168400 [Buddleja alternifolia]|uniref:Phylloplanin n=1 Tax=Buddleja alternifolia TaxID=168488 RepID=A0AAV6XIG0_9LAMI|nr:hypothetical protein BUALT_Bualt07G0168400 [Buddleja alternifolia]